MKKLLFITLIIFIFTSILFGKFQASSDGFTSFGFPFIFFRYTEGKCVDCITTFKLELLILDLIFAFIVSLLIEKIRKRFYN